MSKKNINFNDFNIKDEIKRAIKDMGFEEPSLIQKKAIPEGLKGRDLIGQAQTGTGKTVAFAVPALNKIWIEDKSPQVLVLTPTRELAIQVAGEFGKLSQYMKKLRILPVYGGQPIGRQTRFLKKGVHVVIGTPGRVIDHINRGNLDVSAIETLVLDEADEMLDMGFIDDIEKIIKRTPKNRQTLLFSATISKDIKRIANKYQNNPEHIKIKPTKFTVPKINQYYFEDPRNKKISVLCNILDLYDINLALVFCNTKKQVDFLKRKMKSRGYSVGAIHGDMKQTKRDRVMDKFRKGKIDLLIATDVAARGIDVPNVEVVFNYDVPSSDEFYVHRIGRTGRAGKVGYAFTFVSGRDVKQFRSIRRNTHQKIKQRKAPTFEDVEMKKYNIILNEVKNIIDNKDLSKNINLIENLMVEDYDSVEIAAALLKLIKKN